MTNKKNSNMKKNINCVGKQNNLKEIICNRGITLITLVITIVLILILSAVTINISLGQNGIFKRAKQAKIQTQIAEYIDKVELSRVQVIIDKEGNYTLDDLIEQIYKDKIVEKGNITKLEEGISAKIVTKEGYIFIITKNTIEYIGNSYEEATVKEAVLTSTTTDGTATLIINVGLPKETIQVIELYEEGKGKLRNIVVPTGMSKIQKETMIELPFYEDKVYYIKVIGSSSSLESEKLAIEKNTNVVRTANDLKKLATLVNNGEKFTDQTIKQLENIDLSEVCNNQVGSWEPIGHNTDSTVNWFDGTYDGAGKQITNLYINETKEPMQIGLFGFLGYNGKIQNLTVEGTISTHDDNYAVAGIVGRSEGTIEKCINNVEVNSMSNNAGGIVGNNLGIIKDCVNKANIYGAIISGGIASYNQRENTLVTTSNIRYGEVINCTNEGKITADGYIAGGIVGTNSEKIENCKNIGSVTSKAQIDTSKTGKGTGGIVGETTANIVNCSNKGTIKSDWGWVGGIAGHAGENVKIEKCYNYVGTVETLTYAAGGIVGRIESGSIENSYNILLGNSYIRTGGGNAGGIAGTCFTNLVVKNCYNIGNNIFSIESDDYKGLIVGALQNNQTIIENCYYDKESSLAIVFLDGYTLKSNTSVAKELSQFKLNKENENSVAYGLNNYISSEVWDQETSINDGYPYLKENK